MTLAVEHHGGSWVYTWADEYGVGIGVDQVRETRTGHPCQISIHALDFGGAQGGHLFRGTFNLDALSARVNLARHLGQRTNGTVPWGDLLEVVCLRTLDEFQAGDPPVDLANVLVGGDRWLIDPLLPLGETTILYGPGGSYKSMFCLALGVLLVTPGLTMPHLTLHGGATRVLYLDWESNAREHAERYRALCNGWGIGVAPDAIYYRAMARSLVADQQQISELRAQFGTDVLIYDSAAGACGQDLKDDANVVPMLNAMREIGGTRVLVAHMSHAEVSRTQAAGHVYGNIFFENYARALWEVRVSDEGDDDAQEPHTVGAPDRAINPPASARVLALFNRKSSGARQLRRPLSLGIVWQGGQTPRIQIGKAALLDAPDLAQRAPLDVRIRDALRAGAKTADDLAELLEGNADSIGRVLRRMPDARITNTDDARGRGNKAMWGLAMPPD